MQVLARSAVADERCTTVSTQAASAAGDASISDDAVLQGPRNDPRGVRGLHVEQIREIHRQAGLSDAFDKTIWKTVDAQALKRADTVVPPFGQRPAVEADQFKTSTAAVVGAHLESRCKDQTVQLIGHAVDDHTGFGDPLAPLVRGCRPVSRCRG